MKTRTRKSDHSDFRGILGRFERSECADRIAVVWCGARCGTATVETKRSLTITLAQAKGEPKLIGDARAERPNDFVHSRSIDDVRALSDPLGDLPPRVNAGELDHRA